MTIPIGELGSGISFCELLHLPSSELILHDLEYLICKWLQRGVVHSPDRLSFSLLLAVNFRISRLERRKSWHACIRSNSDAGCKVAQMSLLVFRGPQECMKIRQVDGKF